jgi:hypothetical protein
MGGTRNQVFENREVRLIDFRRGALDQKDVKNEDRSGYVLENNGEMEIEKDRSGYVDESKEVAR